MDYLEFLEKKSQCLWNDGFPPLFIPDFLFDFQKALSEWGIRKGRCALFEDCGLGKTPQQLVWAENVVRHTNKPVLVLTPLAVSYQTVLEGEKFQIEVHRSSDGKVFPGINVTNYERLHHFNPNDFGGVVCDESSILKSFDGTYKKEITEFMRKVKYRLLCTATAAPNDYIELGTSSEALGELGYTDMLGRFFKNDQNTIKAMKFQNQLSEGAKWRFKGHAEEPFWKWVCSWARAIRKPSDLGFNDDRFVLPKLTEQEHMVTAETLAPGMLFPIPAIGLKEQRQERRRTVDERCQKAADLVNNTGKPALVWCHLNDEGDILERFIYDSVQISGRDPDDEKEEKFIAFTKGQIRVLVTKPKIGAWGLNFQHCSHVVSFPSHSFEQYYQGVRRCWRFGQKNPVQSDIITTEGELDVLKNLRRKSRAADVMFDNLVKYMSESFSVSRGQIFAEKEIVPSWL